MVEPHTHMREFEPKSEPQGFFERLHARSGDHYVRVIVVAALFLVPVATVGVEAVMSVSYGLSWSEGLGYLARDEVAIAFSMLVGSPLVYRWMGPAIRWEHGMGPEAAAAAWRSWVPGLPRIVAALAGIVVVVVGVPVQVHRGNHLAMSAGDVAVMTAFSGVLILGAAVLIYLVLDQAARPMLSQVVSELPPDFEVPRTVSLGAKLLALLLALNLVTAMLMAGLSDLSLSREERMVLALAVSFSLPLVLALLLRQSLLLRTGDLLQALHRVRGGDLTVKLPNLAGDEFDRVGESFNDMVDRLRRNDEELRESRARVVAASDAARQKVERDLHDGAQQHLVLLNLKLAQAEKRAETDPQAAAEMIRRAKADLARALEELRDLAHGIYPSVLTEDGLPEALREAAARSAIPASVECDGAGRYASELEAAVYFCCLEALQNAAKYAGAEARVAVRLAENERGLHFEVADDGAGFDPVAAASSAGVQNMRDRIGALGGTLEIESAPGAGTRVAGTVPVATAGTSA